MADVKKDPAYRDGDTILDQYRLAAFRANQEAKSARELSQNTLRQCALAQHALACAVRDARSEICSKEESVSEFIEKCAIIHGYLDGDVFESSLMPITGAVIGSG